MSMRSWIRCLFTRPATRPIRKTPRRARLTLEALEDRWLPSAVTVGNLTDYVNGDTSSIAALISNSGEDGISLREAVEAANHTAGADTINFAVSGTITLGGTQLELTDKTGATTITGPSVTINGGGLSRVFQVDSLVTASISGLTISGGSAGTSGNGGGLANLGNTTLSNCTLSGNSAGDRTGDVFGYGGAVYGGAGSTTTLNDCTVSGNHAVWGGGLNSHGTLTMNRCTINNNDANHGGALENYLGTATLNDCTVTDNTSAASGGGLFLQGGQTTLTNCTISGNEGIRGGGLWVFNGTVQLVNCTISGNDAVIGDASRPSRGGGMYNHHGDVTFTSCTISGNTAVEMGGGLVSYGGQTTLTNSTVSGNSTDKWGGGLFAKLTTVKMVNSTISGNTARTQTGGGVNNDTSNLTLTNCTISGNSAAQGGGVNNFSGNATLTNCTISGNTAFQGSGLWSTGTSSALGSATLVNCTVSGNAATGGVGGGIGRDTNGRLTLGNTIVAGNTASGSGGWSANVYGAVVSLGYNLIGMTDGSSGWVSTDLKGTTASPLNPLLAPLGFYGGPTQTMPLLPGSRAIDAGSNSLAAGITADQRGLTRTVNTTVDIGAFESSGFTMAVVSGGGQTAVTGKAFVSPLVVKVTANNSLEPLAGGLVTFTTPTSGASAVLSTSTATIGAETIGPDGKRSGTASVTATANGSVGIYTVTATAQGITNMAIFTLTNKKNGK